MPLIKGENIKFRTKFMVIKPSRWIVFILQYLNNIF